MVWRFKIREEKGSGTVSAKTTTKKKDEVISTPLANVYNNFLREINLAPRASLHHHQLPSKNLNNNIKKTSTTKKKNCCANNRSKLIGNAVRVSLEYELFMKQIHSELRKLGVATHAGVQQEMLRGFVQTSSTSTTSTQSDSTNNATGTTTAINTADNNNNNVSVMDGYENWCFAIKFNYNGSTTTTTSNSKMLTATTTTTTTTTNGVSKPQLVLSGLPNKSHDEGKDLMGYVNSALRWDRLGAERVMKCSLPEGQPPPSSSSSSSSSSSVLSRDRAQSIEEGEEKKEEI